MQEEKYLACLNKRSKDYIKSENHSSYLILLIQSKIVHIPGNIMNQMSKYE